VNRIAENSLAKELFYWEPKILFKEGLHKIIDWYFKEKNPEKIKDIVENKLTER